MVTDPDGDERGSEKIVLTNDDLGDGDSSVVNVDVTTDIGATTSALVVTGSVFREASEIPIDNVFDISVTNTTNGMQVSGMTDANGMYSQTLFNPGAAVGETRRRAHRDRIKGWRTGRCRNPYPNLRPSRCRTRRNQ